MRARKKKIRSFSVSLDEIFMDSENIPGFERERLEGRLEKPISRKTFLGVSLFFIAAASVLLFRIFNLEVIRGEALALRAENNHLKEIMVLPQRGIIYDREKRELAWNTPEGRTYTDLPGLNLLIGYVGPVSKEELKSEKEISIRDTVGKEEIERSYEEILHGTTGLKILEINSKGEVVSDYLRVKVKPGENIELTVDAELQSFVYETIKETAENYGFEAGAAVIMNAENGEILTLTSYPEYDAEILSRGEEKEKIESFLTHPKKPFLNRAVRGLYAPGSIIKPLLALAALEEGVISPEKEIFSSGSISIPNPFFPDKKSVFYDWKAHGWTDMRKAIAVSSDVYFYTIGGGYGEIQGLGIGRLKKYAGLFGFGSKTGLDLKIEEGGTVPDPEKKSQISPEDPVWRVGDTYNVSIGQGNFQITPIQAAVFASALGNGGKIVVPRLNLKTSPQTKEPIAVKGENFEIVKEGMRLAVTEGTAKGLQGLLVKMAAKTGTAEIGSGAFINSWLIGFFPYENPRFSIAVVMEKGRAENLVGATFVTREIMDWLFVHREKYLNYPSG